VGPGTPGTRLEVKLDTGGHNIVEVKGRVRIYRDDRVRHEGGRIALNDQRTAAPRQPVRAAGPTVGHAVELGRQLVDRRGGGRA
jgi:hypothetical protein